MMTLGMMTLIEELRFFLLVVNAWHTYNAEVVGPGLPAVGDESRSKWGMSHQALFDFNLQV